MTIDQIPSKSNLNQFTDSVHQLSADEVNAIVDALKSNRDNIATLRQYALYVDRGDWKQGSNYYFESVNADTGMYETSCVWYNGCKYRCRKNMTAQKPTWNSSDWVMIEGDSEFHLSFEESETILDPDNINVPLTIRAVMYNTDVTGDILSSDVVWTRYSEDAEGAERAASDAVWNLRHEGSGKSILLTSDDMGFDGYMPKTIRFTATVTLRDSTGNEAALAKVKYEY